MKAFNRHKLTTIIISHHNSRTPTNLLKSNQTFMQHVCKSMIHMHMKLKHPSELQFTIKIKLLKSRVHYFLNSVINAVLLSLQMHLWRKLQVIIVSSYQFFYYVWIFLRLITCQSAINGQNSKIQPLYVDPSVSRILRNELIQEIINQYYFRHFFVFFSFLLIYKPMNIRENLNISICLCIYNNSLIVIMCVIGGILSY
ncbi:unnamed protein product (macronuclear) [Paramecium tetraurelia]|uniref:Transmembrane protein n=1 Tax=Paramecium tetraurelia TaxID=5888 RepID=A0DHH2_PARTE|nr:uncharacterized protein GSPATT00016876001 [Paramecium tetraurelia]CAK82489.1 unnamed protein product [Paramecium tetraurelia]|eukprot:XP_001449886.1 hypothetical protein (macronuclear) [Paramecium tetraurelia strain d4-2]